MAFFDFLEPEEWVGHKWHRLVGKADSYPAHPDAAVSFADVQGALGPFFRCLGGDGGVAIEATKKQTSKHRLSFRQRIGMDSEKLTTSSFDGISLRLPDRIDLFADPSQNRSLYFWLAALYSQSTDEDRTPPSTEPFALDLANLKSASEDIAATLAAYPGLSGTYRRLCAALLAVRPMRDLPETEAAVERLVTDMLQGQPFDAEAAEKIKPSRKYSPYLPVPLWGHVLPPRQPEGARPENEETGGGSEDAGGFRLHAQRRELDQTEREDSIILNNMEKILGLAETINLNRSVDDDDEDNARKAADDLDEITVSKHQKRASTKLALDLDLPPEEMELGALAEPKTYPEWDYRRRRYHADYCAVVTGPAPEEGEDWAPDPAANRRIRAIRQQFEAMRPKRVVLRRQRDGFDLDMDAVVRSRSDVAAGGTASNGLYLDARDQERDMSIALLVDQSLSTDAWLEGRRVLDVEKEAVSVFAAGLAASGDDHAIYTFTSRRRKYVRVQTVKSFEETTGPTVRRRIAALKPGYYTRIGAAVRHLAAEMEKRPNQHRLILLLTDGKPNDLDHYEGRYAVEDTRKAIGEARRSGVAVFGVTVDTKARDYFPYIFGRGAYQIVSHPEKLPSALPKIYRQLIK